MIRDNMNQLAIRAYKWAALRHTFGPRAVLAETTKACNLQCPGCRRNYKSGSIYSEPGPTHLTVEALRRIVTTTNISYVRFEGDGEPLCNPHFKDLMRFCKKMGIKSMMTSNGTLLNESWVEFLQENGMTRIHVSFDGATEGTYERTKVGADYAKVLYNCKLVGDSKIQLFMNVVLFSNEVVDELPRYVELSKKVGATGIHYMKMQQDSLDFGRPPNLRLHRDTIKKFNELTRRSNLLVVGTCTDGPAFVPCYDPFTNPFVLLNNDVYACTYLANLRRFEVYQGKLLSVPYQNYKMGNLEDSWMRDIWFGPDYAHLRERLKRNRRAFSGVKTAPEVILRGKRETARTNRFSFCDFCLCQWGQSGL
jgi:MoaA/NifB/PqqE/SkfB family radical SAM enzyme